MSIENIRTLSNNPFFMSKIIQCFLTGYEKSCDIQTMFYILPVILYKPSRERLVNAKSSSSLYSLFGETISKRSDLLGFVNRYDLLRELTVEAIIILASESKIKINDSVSLFQKLPYKLKDKNIQEYLRASFYLGKVLSNVNIIEFEKYVGVA